MQILLVSHHGTYSFKIKRWYLILQIVLICIHPILISLYVPQQGFFYQFTANITCYVVAFYSFLQVLLLGDFHVVQPQVTNILLLFSGLLAVLSPLFIDHWSSVLPPEHCTNTHGGVCRLLCRDYRVSAFCIQETLYKLLASILRTASGSNFYVYEFCRR